jgi:hypothetical protein
MATIIELVEEGHLIKLEPELDADEFEARRIYLIADCRDRLDALLGSMVSQWNTEIDPMEQFDEIVYHFAVGGELNYPRQFHDLRHRKDGIWQLKTPDLRLFGFFARKDVFICTDVADANVVKTGQYSGYCEQSGYRRDQLNLDEPKFIPGMEPQNVVSNCYS